MRRLIRYVKYVLQHKWYLFQVWMKVGGVPFWRILIHDWSKFLPRELFAYACMFYDIDGNKRPKSETALRFQVDGVFKRAWLRHIHSQPHHWQYWLLVRDNGEMDALLMPEVFVIEMILDWKAAGQAQENPTPTLKWYNERREMIVLHKDTRALLEKKLVELSLKGIP